MLVAVVGASLTLCTPDMIDFRTSKCVREFRSLLVLTFTALVTPADKALVATSVSAESGTTVIIGVSMF